MMELKVRRIGNSLGVLLPKELLEELKLQEGDSTLVKSVVDGVTLMKRKTARTLGKGERSRDFAYTGSPDDGVVLLFPSTNVKVPAQLFKDALAHFSGREVPGGFDKTDAPADGFGKWVQYASGKTLTPQHGSFVAAILCSEADVECRHQGNAVMLKFPAH